MAVETCLTAAAIGFAEISIECRSQSARSLCPGPTPPRAEERGESPCHTPALPRSPAGSRGATQADTDIRNPQIGRSRRRTARAGGLRCLLLLRPAGEGANHAAAA